VGVLLVNTLDIDQGALLQEAENALNFQRQPGSFGSVDPQTPAAAPAESWAPVVAGMMGLADVIAPNWELQPAEKDAFADALSPILDQLFPGGFGNERWAPYVRLLAVSAGIVMVRVENGQLKPLRAPPAPAPAPVGANVGGS
jgi:hypothetical protein